MGKKARCLLCGEVVTPGIHAKRHMESTHGDIVEGMNWPDIRNKYLQDIIEEEIPKETTTEIPQTVPSVDKTPPEKEQETPQETPQETKKDVHTPSIPQVPVPSAQKETPYEGREPRVNFEGTLYTPEELIMATGLAGVYFLMREEFTRVLNRLPKKIGKAEMDWVLDIFDRDERHKKDPEALYNLLSQYTNITPIFNRDVVSKVFAVPKKYERTINVVMNTSPGLFVPYQIPEPRRTQYVNAQPAEAPQPYRPPPVGQQPYSQPQQPYDPWWQSPPPQTDRGALTEDRMQQILDTRDARRDERDKEKSMMQEINRLRQENEEIKRTPQVSPEIVELRQKLAAMENNQVNELKKELDIIKQGRMNDPGVVGRMEEIANIIKSADKITGKEEVNALRAQVTGTIDDRSLRMREIEMGGRIKELESGAQKEMVGKIADAVGGFGETLGTGLGRQMAGGIKGGTQMAMMGNHIRGVCPKCGAEFTAPANATSKICENCGAVLDFGPTTPPIPTPPAPVSVSPAAPPPLPPLPTTEETRGGEVAPPPEATKPGPSTPTENGSEGVE